MGRISRTEMVARAREVIERETQAVRALADQIDDRLADVVDLLLNCQGHVLVTGAVRAPAGVQRVFAR